VLTHPWLQDELQKEDGKLDLGVIDRKKKIKREKMTLPGVAQFSNHKDP